MSVWFSRVHREFEAGNITRAWRDVLLALGRFQSCRFGIFPSHAVIAARAGCCARTVQRALEAAKGLGLLEWVARRVKAGWRSLRASNRYALKLPAGPVRTVGLRGGGKDHTEEGRKESGLLKSLFGRPRLSIQPPIRTPEEQMAILLGAK